MDSNYTWWLMTQVALIVVIHLAMFLLGPNKGLDKERSIHLFGKLWRFRVTNIESKRFWKSVDYVWLSVAFLGILSAVGDLRRNEAVASLDRIKQELEQELISVSEIIRDKITCDFHPLYPPCRWTITVQEEIAAGRGRVRWPIDDQIDWSRLAAKTPEKDFFGQPFDEEKANVLRDLKMRLTRAQKLNQQGLRFSAASHPNAVEAVVFSIWPICLMLVIAIRWVKVTGERRLEKT